MTKIERGKKRKKIMFMLLLWLLLMCSPQSSFTALIWHPFAAHLLLFSIHSLAFVFICRRTHTHTVRRPITKFIAHVPGVHAEKNTKACKFWLQSLPSVQNRKKRKRERYTKKKKERNTHQRKNWKTGNGDYIFFHFLQNHASKWSIFDVFILLLLLLWRSMNKISACLICDRTDNM